MGEERERADIREAAGEKWFLMASGYNYWTAETFFFVTPVHHAVRSVLFRRGSAALLLIFTIKCLDFFLQIKCTCEFRVSIDSLAKHNVRKHFIKPLVFCSPVVSPLLLAKPEGSEENAVLFSVSVLQESYCVFHFQ